VRCGKAPAAIPLLDAVLARRERPRGPSVWRTLGAAPALAGRLSYVHRHRKERQSAGSAPQEGKLLTPDDYVDIMSTHESHQANTSQGILDAIPAG
jgi:hypothetical protein